MKKYEYKLLTINVAKFRKQNFQAELDARFNELGNQGWELDKMEPINTSDIFFMGSATSDFFVVFKREKG